MSYHLVVDYLVDLGTSYQVEKLPSGVSKDVVKYNMLVDGLNISTVLLAAAAAFACLFAFSTALMFAGAGFLLRHLVTYQRDKFFVLPDRPKETKEELWIWETARKLWKGTEAMLVTKTKESILFENLKKKRPKGWVISDKIFFGLIPKENKIVL